MPEEKKKSTEVKAKASSVPLPQQYVFFCEGSTEAILIDKINSVVYGDVDKIYAHAWLPKVRKGYSYFTPKRIKDYYLDTIGKFAGVWDYKYITYKGFRPKKHGGLKKIRKKINNGAQVCLLVDTDVFFKRLGADYKYDNLTKDQNQMLRGNNNAPNRITFLNEFSDQANNYRFLEQELTFEDFVVLFFVGEDKPEAEGYDDRYMRWFSNRFGRGQGQQRSYADRRKYIEGHHGDLTNQGTNGEILKRELVRILAEYDPKLRTDIEIQKGNIDTWLEQPEEDKENKLATIISNWVVNQMQNINLERRLRIVENRLRYNQQQGWPTQFGLIDFLKANIKKEDKNER